MADPAFYPEHSKTPLRVYLAGRISGDSDWRYDCVTGLRDWRKNYQIDAGMRWPEMSNAVFGHTYVGPYPETCSHHGCESSPVSHSVERSCGPVAEYDDSPDKPHNSSTDRGLIRKRCLSAICRSDFLFVWVDSRECYGTLTEIGFAMGLWAAMPTRAIGVQAPELMVAGPSVSDNELWFACTGIGRSIYRYDNPAAALRVALPVLPERVDYHTYILSQEWRARADAAKARAGYRCQVCNKGKDQIVLDAHHRTYERLGKELPEDITVLCRACHELYELNRKATTGARV